MVKLKKSQGMRRRCCVLKGVCFMQVVVTFSLNIQSITDVIISAGVSAPWTPQSRLLDSLSATCRLSMMSCQR